MAGLRLKDGDEKITRHKHTRLSSVPKRDRWFGLTHLGVISADAKDYWVKLRKENKWMDTDIMVNLMVNLILDAKEKRKATGEVEEIVTEKAKEIVSERPQGLG